MRPLTLIKRVAGWIALIGLPLSLLSSRPLAGALVNMSNDELLWITGAWTALACLSLIALIVWCLCWIALVVAHARSRRQVR
jgi:hypothetical protein